MKHTPIIPNRHIVPPPFEPHLQIMILRNNLQEIRFQNLALALRDAIDPPVLELVRGPEERLPARDGIGAHDGVAGGEVEAGVFWGSALGVDEGGAELRGYAVEVGLVVRRG